VRTLLVLTATLSFAAAASLLVIAPGPDTLLVLRNSLGAGRRRGLVTIAGIVSGLLVWATIASIGLAALLRASEVGYTIVRVAGATYLIAFGIRLLIARRNQDEQQPVDPLPPPRSAKSTLAAYLSGLATNLLNPKVGIFFISFLPVFIPKGASVGWTSALFAAIFIVEGTAWLFLIVFFASRLGEQATEDQAASRTALRCRDDRFRYPPRHRGALSALRGARRPPERTRSSSPRARPPSGGRSHR
jgi:threonine/homoserine/homoserine lactone efflux protein